LRQTDPVFKTFPGSTRAGKTAMLRVLSIGKLMSGMHGALSIVELISARLWRDIHDLVESLDGALSAPGPEFGPGAQDTARTLLIRLKLRQAAWRPADGPVPLTDVKALARGLPERVGIDASPLDPDSVFAPETGRNVLNLLLLAAESLPSGGIIMLAGSVDDLFVRLAGPAAAWPAGLALCLSDASAAQSALTEPPGMQSALTALLAQEAGLRLSMVIPPVSRTEPPMLRLGG